MGKYGYICNMNKQSLLIPLSIALLACAIWFKSCTKEQPLDTSEPIILQARSLQAAIDSTKAATAKQHDTVTVWRTRWLAAKSVTVSAVCDSVVKYIVSTCDSLVKHDSLLINGLTEIVNKQDTLISKLWQAHSIDSVTIGKLNKRLKWQRVKTKAAFVGGLMTGGLVWFVSRRS